MNVLGVEFDSKLNWSKHISKQIIKANKALYAIKMIKKYISQSEILTLFTSNFYSILYYNSEIWHIPMLKPELKQMLFAASAKALRLPKYTQIQWNRKLISTSHAKEPSHLNLCTTNRQFYSTNFIMIKYQRQTGLN